QHGEAPHEAARPSHAGRHHRQRDADPRLERRDVVQGLWRDAHRLPLRPRGQQAPHLPQVRGRDLMATETQVPRLRTRFDTELKPALKSELALDNVMEVPRLAKIVVNMGVGRATQQRSLLDGAVKDLTIITGQKPSVRKAKKSIATFKLREGNEIGAMV